MIKLVAGSFPITGIDPCHSGLHPYDPWILDYLTLKAKLHPRFFSMFVCSNCPLIFADIAYLFLLGVCPCWLDTLPFLLATCPFVLAFKLFFLVGILSFLLINYTILFLLVSSIHFFVFETSFFLNPRLSYVDYFGLTMAQGVFGEGPPSTADCQADAKAVVRDQGR